MRGLGKTTLAQLVYNDSRIDGSFSLKVWVCVSHDLNNEQIVSNIVISAPPYIHSHNDVELLKYKLVGQKFLLVLDNVWNEDPLKWDELRNLIPTDANGKDLKEEEEELEKDREKSGSFNNPGDTDQTSF
ncbi:hypothetical protein RIF29_39417 [Crotalaria pallida]|uniref:NB-ARC domain-containing protein n=1 Tax=Crotalaria pallida TaxID=3830 RepID=A0AAN9HT98_CROPI